MKVKYNVDIIYELINTNYLNVVYDIVYYISHRLNTFPVQYIPQYC